MWEGNGRKWGKEEGEGGDELGGAQMVNAAAFSPFLQTVAGVRVN